MLNIVLFKEIDTNKIFLTSSCMEHSYALPKEKDRRCDLRKYHHYGTECLDFCKRNCKKVDACEFAHGVFACSLIDSVVKGRHSWRRSVCFFTYMLEQITILTQQSPWSANSYDGSPLRRKCCRLCLPRVRFLCVTCNYGIIVGLRRSLWWRGWIRSEGWWWIRLRENEVFSKLYL